MNKVLASDLTAAEDTSNNTLLTDFDANGFTVGNNNRTNQSGITHVAWCWKAGGTAVSNTDGSDTSSVSANQNAGFSIVSLSKTDSNTRTYGHGLNSVPEMIILKRTASADDWYVYHKDLGNTVRISLNSSAAKVTGTGVWGSTTPTDSVFTLQNQSGGAHIAYCFTSITDYQKIGSYTASSGDDVVTTGFKPRFVMLKRTDSAGHWEMHDAVRFPSLYDENGASKRLRANDSSAEALFNNSPIFFTDTGFTLDSSVSGDSYNDYDANGGTYIYLAIK